MNNHGHAVGVSRPATRHVTAGSPPAPATSRRRAPGGAIAVLTAVAYFLVFADRIDSAAIGPRTAFLIVAPVLLAPIVLSAQMPFRDAGESVADRVSAALVAIAGFATIHVVGNHLPDLTAPWALPLLSVVVWSVCSTTVLFGAYHSTALWPLWFLALGAAAPTPLLVWLNLGGSPLGAVTLAGLMGSIGVFATARRMPPEIRTPLAACGATIAAAIALTFGGRSGLPIEVSTLGALPPAAAVVVLWLGARRHRARTGADARAVLI